MQETQLQQALSLTIQELNLKISDEITAKNLLAIQLTELEQAQEENIKEKKALQDKVIELETLLDEQTRPAGGDNYGNN